MESLDGLGSEAGRKLEDDGGRVWALLRQIRLLLRDRDSWSPDVTVRGKGEEESLPTPGDFPPPPDGEDPIRWLLTCHQRVREQLAVKKSGELANANSELQAVCSRMHEEWVVGPPYRTEYHYTAGLIQRESALELTSALAHRVSALLRSADPQFDLADLILDSIGSGFGEHADNLTREIRAVVSNTEARQMHRAISADEVFGHDVPSYVTRRRCGQSLDVSFRRCPTRGWVALIEPDSSVRYELLTSEEKAVFDYVYRIGDALIPRERFFGLNALTENGRTRAAIKSLEEDYGLLVAHRKTHRRRSPTLVAIQLRRLPSLGTIPGLLRAGPGIWKEE